MLHGTTIILISFAYLGLLFAIAYFADQRADAGRSVIASPYIYSLSLAVYATAWTFYGSVGRAASDGVGFLPIYIGPTLMIALWWVVLRKILRISKQNRITSLADFIASRYGKSALLGGLVTIIAVIGILPYISLQLKAVSNSFAILVQYPEIIMPAKVGRGSVRERRRIVDGADSGRLHDRLRHAPSRRRRASPGHGGRDRVRIAGEAARVSRGGRVRHLRHLRRLRRPVRARRGAAQAPGDDDAARRRRRRLRELGMAHDPVDDGDHVPAAAVPGRGGRERRREAPQQGDLAVPALHARDQHLRAADRLRRPAALSRTAPSTPIPSCSRCRWPRNTSCSRCSCSSAASRRRPA